VLAGCYAPEALPGAPCDEREICPSSQVCVAGRCERTAANPADAISSDATRTWSVPTIVGITPGHSKSDASFTPDRLTIVFTDDDDLYMAKRAAIGSAFTVTALTSLNTAMIEKSPEISADGETIYFASDRAGTYDIYVSTNKLGTWMPPSAVSGWNTAAFEQDVAISPDELTAFIAIGASDLRRSIRASKTSAWSMPVSLGVAWGTHPTAPSINAAGDVYFHANDPRDLFVARKEGATFASPVLVPDLNTATGREAAPCISMDDRYLMFEQDTELVESMR